MWVDSCCPTCIESSSLKDRQVGYDLMTKGVEVSLSRCVWILGSGRVWGTCSEEGGGGFVRRGILQREWNFG